MLTSLALSASRAVRGDAPGYAFANDPRRTRLCTFEHVCLNGTHVFFPLEDVDDRMKLQRILSLCALSKAQLEGRERPPICTCFMKGTDPVIVSYVRPSLGQWYWIRSS